MNGGGCLPVASNLDLIQSRRLQSVKAGRLAQPGEGVALPQGPGARPRLSPAAGLGRFSPDGALGRPPCVVRR